MKFIYPAVFRPLPDGSYEGFFPDLAGCISHGETLEEAVDNANEAARDWLSLEMTEDEPLLPGVTDFSDLCLRENEIVRNICVTIRLTDGWDE